MRNEKSKANIIIKLTRLDTSAYRCIGHARTGKFTHEPEKYRLNLHKIYNEFTEEQLIKLLNTRKGY